jgi:hypothetical protein
LVSSEGGGSPKGGVHGGAARPKGNDREGRRPVVEVGGSRLGKVVGTWVIVGVASTERVSGQRQLGGGRRWKACFGDRGMGAVRGREVEPEWEGNPQLQPRAVDKGAWGGARG